MKAGFEDRKKVYVVIGLLVVAALLFFRIFNSGGNSTVSAASVSNPALTAQNNTPASPGRPRASQPPLNLDPTLRTSTLKAVESQEYKGSGRNIFEYAQVELPKPKTQIIQPPPPQNLGPPPPPPPPPINLKFYGFASRPGEPTRIFLSEGEDIFIGGEGEIINRRYKILHIGKTSVEIEDTQYNNRQTIPLTQG
jgi:hypothetical protein